MSARVISGEFLEYEKYGKSFGEFYFEYAEKYKDRIFQIDVTNDTKETYGELKEKCIRVAINLRKLGVAHKSMITTCLKHSLNQCVPVISGAFLGAITGALHYSQSIREWNYCLKMIPADILVIDEEYVSNMEKAIENLEKKPLIIVMGQSEKHKTFDELLELSEEEALFRPYVAEDLKETAVIQFSSGTTGNPKGICLSHWCVLNATILVIIKRGQVGVNNIEVILSLATYYWVSALITTVLSFFKGNIRLNPPPTYTATTLLEIIHKYRVDAFFTNPVSLRSMLQIKELDRYDLSSIKYLITFGSALTEPEHKKFKEIFKNASITQAYGSTETLSAGTNFYGLDEDYCDKHIKSCGKSSPNCQIKIEDVTTRALLGPNQIGEICMKSPFMMNGYYNTDSSTYYDKDGFFRTGDLGRYDEEELFYFEGRIKDGFKYKTFQIPSLYLESILMEHPDIENVGVFGIPNKIDDHHPAACVVLKKGAISTVEDIEEYFTKNVSSQYRLRGGIKIFDKLPMTPTMKIQRNKLLDLFMSS